MMHGQKNVKLGTKN